MLVPIKNDSLLSVHFMHFAQETLPDLLGHQVFQWVQPALGDPVLKCKEVLTYVETICQLQLSTKSLELPFKNTDLARAKSEASVYILITK